MEHWVGITNAEYTSATPVVFVTHNETEAIELAAAFVAACCCGEETPDGQPVGNLTQWEADENWIGITGINAHGDEWEMEVVKHSDHDNPSKHWNDR